jgi:hypothetical protein
MINLKEDLSAVRVRRGTEKTTARRIVDPAVRAQLERRFPRVLPAFRGAALQFGQPHLKEPVAWTR